MPCPYIAQFKAFIEAAYGLPVVVGTVENVFQESAKSARSLDEVVAFATKAGVDAVMPYIRQIAERGQASITVGLYQGVTEPAALRALAKARKELSGRLKINVATTPNLHRKVYVFRFPKSTTVLVGSAARW